IKIRTVKGVSREVNGQWNCWADPDMKIAYVRLTGFMEDTAAELSDQLEALHRDGMRGVILDLRFNPGGLLKTAVEICDLLLPADRVIVSTKGRASSPQEVSSSRRNGLMDVPMIVLVNDISASASEIVSGAIQDHHRGLIVGERTFGKGLVQNLEALGGPSGASYIKLTTAKYYLPNGRCIQKEPGNAIWGVDPDVLVSLVPKEMRRVLELRRKGDVLKGKNQQELSLDALDFDDMEPDEEPNGAMEGAEAATSQPTTTQAADAEDEDEKDENIHPEIDPQYEAALLVMRVRLLSNEPWPIESRPVTAKAAGR
ncbi:MAG: hypothetical protein JXA69_04810, partial [Phycisphaerae bacterium]|nr:hypothetical protein [Phycisphaerae bacterium]